MVDTFARMRQLIGTTAEWLANDIIIGNGEVALELISPMTWRQKVGDGVNVYSALPYLDPVGDVRQGVLATDFNLPAAGAWGTAITLGTIGTAGQKWLIHFGFAFYFVSDPNPQFFGARVLVGAAVPSTVPVMSTRPGENAWGSGSAIVTLAAPSAIVLQGAKPAALADGHMVNQSWITAQRYA
jgi:hypothetical protein